MSVPPRLLPLLLAGWLGAAACATPQPQPRPQLVGKKGAASAWLATPGEKQTLPLADNATVMLRVEAPAPLEVEVLEKPKATPKWSLKAEGGPTLREKDKGEAVWEQKYQLEPHDQGEHLVELPPLRYRTGDGEWQKVVWQPVKVRVTTEIKTAEPGAARDITSIEELPPAEPARGWLLWAGLGLGAVLLGVTALAVGRRRAAKPPAPPPHEWALRELARLAERSPAGVEEVEAYHTALSAVLRRYLEGRFQIPAERQTTAEFAEAVRKSSELSAEQQGTLGELLARCDLAKFARVWPSAEECQALVTGARAFVEQTAPKAPASSSPRPPEEMGQG
jgi:hypothetical protein